MRRKAVLATALVLCLASSAQGALSIVVPNIRVHDPGASLASIDIDIRVTGDGGNDQAVDGDLHAQIGSNLPGRTPPDGAPPSPSIAAEIAKNSFAGSFFNNAPNGASQTPSFINSWNVNMAIINNLNNNGQLPTIAAAGLFVTLKVAYSGFHSGSWPIILSGAGAHGPTELLDVTGSDFPMVITDGSFTITPEPNSLVLGLLASAGLFAAAIRKRRSSHA